MHVSRQKRKNLSQLSHYDGKLGTGVKIKFLYHVCRVQHNVSRFVGGDKPFSAVLPPETRGIRAQPACLHHLSIECTSSLCIVKTSRHGFGGTLAFDLLTEPVAWIFFPLSHQRPQVQN